MANWTNQEIEAVWKKGIVVEGCDKNEFRKDQCGAWISRKAYGNRTSSYGWEIDHIKTQANGGSDDLSNLRPLHWENNVAKSDGNLKCVLKSSGNKNVKIA
jgi:hypothetical protein